MPERADVSATGSSRAGPAVGGWTAALVGARLREAAATLADLPMPRHGRPAAPRGAWPDLPPDPAAQQAAADDDAAHRPPPPGAARIRRMEEALPRWLLLIADRRRRQAVYLRASPNRRRDGVLSTRRVGAILGVSHQTVKNWESAGLDEIAAKLNRPAARD